MCPRAWLNKWQRDGEKPEEWEFGWNVGSAWEINRVQSNSCHSHFHISSPKSPRNGNSVRLPHESHPNTWVIICRARYSLHEVDSLTSSHTHSISMLSCFTNWQSDNCPQKDLLFWRSTIPWYHHIFGKVEDFAEIYWKNIFLPTFGNELYLFVRSDCPFRIQI